MSKNTSAKDSDTMTHLDFFKKFKRLSPLGPSLGILGFVLVSGLLLGCFFYLDSQSFNRGVKYHEVSWIGLMRSFPSPPPEVETALNENERPGFLDIGGEGCDVFDGNWVWDDNYPLYQSRDCLFIDDGFRCLENGRPDNYFTKWRWQPKHCNLPRLFINLITIVECLFLFGC